MIIQSKNGSLVLFYNNQLMGGFPLSKTNPLDSYFTQAENVLKQYLKEGSRFDNIKTEFKLYCDNFYKRKMMKKKISSTDYQLFCCCLLVLVRLGFYEFDDFFYVAPKKQGVVKRHYFVKDPNQNYYEATTRVDSSLRKKYIKSTEQYIVNQI